MTLFLGPEGVTKSEDVDKLSRFTLEGNFHSPNRDSVIFDSWFPSLYRSAASRRVISLIKHKYFRNIFDLAILANAVFIALDLDGGENAFLAVFALEIALKLYAFGVRAFFRKMWNVFDVVVVGSAVAVSILRAAIGQDISREVQWHEPQ